MGICTDEGGWISYRYRADWADVTPIYLSDEEKAFVNIACSEKFSEIFAYFRAVFKSKEKSGRVLELTRDAALMNPANYTVWHYRRLVLTALDADLSQELKWCSSLIEENPKNYQLWHHRHLLVESLNNADQELPFTARILHEDAKNYHAWQHRQWVVKTFKLWDDELTFSSRLILEDVRNNSAWNHRYFVISSTTGYTLEELEQEIKMTLELIKKVPNNESSWNYLSGMMEHAEPSQYDNVVESCQQMRKEGIKSSYLLAFIFDYLVEKVEETMDKSHVNQLTEVYEELLQVDPIRKEYWTYMYKLIA